MNDAQEISHGTKRVRQYFDDKGTPFFNCLNRINEGLSDRVVDAYNDWVDDLERNTFVGCLSEHHDIDDANGKLSMWRGYGPRGGVALVVDPYFVMQDTAELETFIYPALYLSDTKAEQCFEDFSKRILIEEEFLKSQGEETLYAWAFDALQTFGVTLKHPAFAEEREWRIVHRPAYRGSNLVPARQMSVRGIPQVVHELPLEHQSENVSLSIPQLIKQVIIGPSESPDVTRQAFVFELCNHMSVAEAQSRVSVAEVPLRVTMAQ